jgi:hypothetical protein
MAWVNWSRHTTPARPEMAILGIELNAGAARAASGRLAHNQVVPLDALHADLPLALSMEHRALAVGRAGVGLVRKLPHLACHGFLPFVGSQREWKGGRHRLSADDALGLVCDRLRGACAGFPSVYLSLPAYLTQAQAARLRVVAGKHGLPVKGTISSHLALGADRAASLMAQPPQPEQRDDGIVPMHRPGRLAGPAEAIVVDADEHALSASLVRIEPAEVRVLSTTVLPRAGVKQWQDRLLDAFADRCVRVCRRDPRDSAEAEQSLFEQIDAGLDALRSGRHVNLNLHAAHWHQDLHLRQSDFEAVCAPLIRSSVEGIRELLGASTAAEPPRAVWMTHDAGRLPGLAQAIYQNMAERTSVGVMRPEATAIAAANLGERWPGDGHLDVAVPLVNSAIENKPQAPVVKARQTH